MSKSSKALIAELKRNKRFMGTCPKCERKFRLADAALFSADEEAPEVALAAIKELRLELKARREELALERERMTKRAQTTSAAVNLGKIIEKIVPSFSTFAHVSGDCRALFEPIDYLIFSGLTKTRTVDSLLFVDVKSGKARLNKTQGSIKKVVQAGSVTFATTHS